MNVNEVKENAGPREFNPRDDLPEAYRKAATRMLEFHANSEIMGAYLERPFIRKAPSLERKMAFSAKVQDEIGHGQMLYRAAEALGVKSRDEMLDDLANGDGKFLNCFHYPMDSYVETPMIAFFVDGAAMRRQATLKKSSWEPYAHAMDKICFEEGMHVKHGESILRELMNGSRREQEMVQDAFETWWPRILQFFGPTDDASTHHDFMSEVGLKTCSNDQLRNSFLNGYMQKAEEYGLEIPEYPRIHEQGDGQYEVVEDDLDWEEFVTVSQNEYEGSIEQIGGRKQAREAASWVRDMFDEQTAAGAAPSPTAAD